VHILLDIAEISTSSLAPSISIIDGKHEQKVIIDKSNHHPILHHCVKLIFQINLKEKVSASEYYNSSYQHNILVLDYPKDQK
jgi:hypothetical protein